MTQYVLWRRGLRGPTVTKLTGTNLNEFDRKNKISDPVAIKPEEEHLSLDDLARLYPPPQQKDQ